VTGTAGSAPALSVDGLVRRFGARTVVDGLSFEVGSGEIFALLGPNGAGKTSTVDVCEGFARPDAGSVRVLGLDPWRARRALRPRVGVMLQSGGAHASARTSEMLQLVARCSADPLDPAWLLDILGLTEVARTPVRRLSGGQVQRLSLAMALVGRPEVLFLDEPTAGLDPQARHLVWELVRACRADGVTVILTTHLLDEAELLADRVLIIDAGREIATGTPAELTGDGPPVVRFRSAPAPALPRLRDALGPAFDVVESVPGSYVVSGGVDARTVPAVADFLAANGVLPTTLDTGRRSLDEVFMELTGRELRS